MSNLSAIRAYKDPGSLANAGALQVPEAIEISLSLIDRLEREVVESFGSITSHGSEIGGLLLGKIEPGPACRISVEDFDAIPCEHSRGPLYRLSPADVDRYYRALQRWDGHSDLHVVGYFRSHTRKGLALDVEDVRLFERHLPASCLLALVIRPSATKPPIAAAFVKEEGAMQAGEPSRAEFPLRSSARMPGAGVPIAKAYEGPLVIPIGPRRGSHCSAPAATETSVVDEVEGQADTTYPPSGEPPIAVEGDAPVVTSSTSVLAPAVAVPPRSRKRLWFASGIIAFLSLASAAVFLYTGLLHRGSGVRAMSRSDAAPLSSRVERQGSESNLDAPQRQGAQSASESVQTISIPPPKEESPAVHEALSSTGGTPSSESNRVTTAALQTPEAPVEPPRLFRKESLSTRAPSNTPVALPEAPALESTLPATEPGAARVALLTNSLSNPPLPGVAKSPAASKRQGEELSTADYAPGHVISSQAPVYPRLAEESGVQGIVTMRVMVGADGKVKSAKVLRGHTMLRSAAIDAVMKWVYTPTRKGGVPVEAETQVSLTFALRR